MFESDVSLAEREILDLADYVYTQTNIKPMSKVIYLLSRLLLLESNSHSIKSATAEYSKVSEKLNLESHGADYSFEKIIQSAQDHFELIYKSVQRIKKYTRGKDSLGIVFDTLLRGKFESGEGLGTYLTPEEVVSPAIELCLFFLKQFEVTGFAGDPCGGTGRFIHTLHQKSREFQFEKYVLADQSAFSIELARINFHIENASNSEFHFVSDSIIDPILNSLNNKFALVVTNPPFGASKYKWSPEIGKQFSSNLLNAIGFTVNGSKIDPAELFVYRNFNLLAMGGVLGIVLPDGVAYGNKLQYGIEEYEKSYNCSISKIAEISLPVATFSLGGTVAKTSFVVFRKTHSGTNIRSIYKTEINHIGFLKKRNRRVADTKGNEFQTFVDGVVSGKILAQNQKQNSSNADMNGKLLGHKRLNEICALRKDYLNNGEKANFHISILDVDETGYIEFRTVIGNDPTTKPIRCKQGDILVSCLNPKIWRVAIIPEIDGTWSCSGEFAVITPKSSEDTMVIFNSLLTNEFQKEAMKLAKGTSSSRQRIQKDSLLTLRIPIINLPKEFLDIFKRRNTIYQLRLQELKTLGYSFSAQPPETSTSLL